MKHKLLCILFSIASLAGFSQSKEEMQKMEAKLAAEKDENKKIELLNSYGELLAPNYFSIAYNYSKQAFDLSEKSKNTHGKIDASNNIGDAYWYHGDFIKAEKYYFDAYKLNDSIHDQRGLAKSMYNMGWILCLQQEQTDKAYYFFNALKIYEKNDDRKFRLLVYDALGSHYSNLYKNTNNKMYLDSALYFYKTAIGAGRSNPKLITESYTNLGALLYSIEEYDEAKSYFEKSLDIALQIGDSTNIFYNKIKIADILSARGQYEEAIPVFKQALAFGKRAGIKQITNLCYGSLHNAYLRKKDYKMAHNYLIEVKNAEEAMNQQALNSKLNNYQNTYEGEKKEADIKALKQANEIQELKNKQSTYFMVGAIGVAMVVLVIAYLLFKQNKQKTEVNHLLKEQNVLISSKKHEIENSIQYAKGIQMALLPNAGDIVKNLKDSFIFYSPKDVVSGDFYWFHEMGNYFYCIAADCTGHGVPGALMSIVSMDKLHQAIFEKQITEPSQILSFLNIEIKNALKQHDDESKQKDGLDLALLRFNKDLTSVVFAGANRPLYHIKQGKVTEYKSDKVAIAGFTPNNYEFTQQNIALQKDDCLYIFSDGYADQFGGPDGKKFMTKNFKTLLESVSNKTIIAQKNAVVGGFNAWKGNYEQVDDILVIGIKI